jgi:hypothetical protein
VTHQCLGLQRSETIQYRSIECRGYVLLSQPYRPCAVCSETGLVRLSGETTMNNKAAENLASESDQLRHLASDLREAYMVLDKLCSQLEGGGIVQARDVEPAVAQTVPKLRRAVAVLNTVTMIGDHRSKPAGAKNSN